MNFVTEAGRRFADIGGTLQEVVVIGASEVREMIVPEPEGVYLVNSGAWGCRNIFRYRTYLSRSNAYCFSYRIPVEGWKPDGWTEPSDEKRGALISSHNVHLDEALKTRQFYQLWIVLCFNVTAGIGVLGVARTMITEIFGSSLPLVDTAFAATYVVMISAFNMVGRFIWASASDYIGRRNTYWIFFLLGIFLYLHTLLSTASKRKPFSSMVSIFLRCNYDHLYNVRWRFCHHTRISC